MEEIHIEEEQLHKELNDGGITLSEYNNRMQELQRDYRAAARESAEGAYQEEMERW